MVYEEYRQRVERELNPLERAAGLISPVDDRIDALARMVAELVAAVKALTIPSPGPGPGPSPSPTPLTIRIVQLINNVALLDTTTIVYPAELADCRASHRVLVHVSNGLDQAIRMTVIGNTSNGYAGGYIITELSCPAGEKRAYGLKVEEWMPYVGVQIQALATPTAGNLNAVVIVQE